MASNIRPSALPVCAHLASIKVVSELEGKGSTTGLDHFAIVYVDKREVAKSEKKLLEPTLQWEWPQDHQFHFHPSSVIKIVIYRESKAHIKNHFVGQHIAKVIELLQNDETITLEDKAGAAISFTIKVDLALVSEHEDMFKDFMATIGADVSRLDGAVRVPPGILVLGRVLQLTKSIMDIVANTDSSPILKASWGVMSAVYTAIKQIELQDDTVRDLAESLREMLGIAKEYPDLLLVKGTTNVIEEISRTSLNVASLIHEYTRPTFMRRTLKSQASDSMKSRIEKCRKSCKDLKQKFNTRMNMDTNRQLGAKTQSIITEIKGASVNIQRTLKTIKNDQLAKDIRHWLDALDSSKNYNEARKKHQKDTFSWFLNGRRFVELREDGGFLWIKGTAGCGKTILCSSIIEKIIQLGKDNASITYAYFFFDGRDSQNNLQLHDKLIRSLVLQLSLQCDGIPEVLVQLYGHGHQQPSTSALEDTFRCIVDGMKLTYVVIDSLDECIDRENTLQWINQMASSQMGNLRIMVASRPERDISDVLQLLDPRCVDLAEQVGQDISIYLDQQVSLVKKWDEETRKIVKSHLIERAQGMFRWIALQIMELKKCSNQHSVMKQLETLPKGLYETYDRILFKISETADHTDTKTFLRWLCFSMRPMTLIELAETVTVHFDMDSEPQYTPAYRYWDEKDVLEKCSGLITESEGTIKLAHFSIKEYLLSNHLCMGATPNFHLASEELSHSLISQTCLVFLLQFDTFNLTDENFSVSSPLAFYAAHYWPSHGISGGIDKAESSWTLELAKRLFKNGGAALEIWTRILNFRIPGHKLQQEEIETGAPLYYSSFFGLLQVTLNLLEDGDININMVGGRYGNALQVASKLGHYTIVKVLLEKGADVNAPGGMEGSALQEASAWGHEAIVKLLLEHGADVNAQGGNLDSPLQEASGSGREAIVKLWVGGCSAPLIAAAAGFRLHVQGGCNTCSLCDMETLDLRLCTICTIIVRYKHHLQEMKTVRWVSSDIEPYLKVFQTAAKGVKLLLENGADVNAQGALGNSALQKASGSGHEAIVKLLLENGADVNAQGALGDSALQKASASEHEAIVKLLLENGADVNAQGGFNGSALYRAVWPGHEVIVKLLLENGADVNAQGIFSGSALQVASGSGHEVIVKLLLEHGADVNARVYRSDTALQKASHAGHIGVVKLLLENGADANAEEGEFCGTALDAAFSRGHIAIVNLLLEYVARPDILS